MTTIRRAWTPQSTRLVQLAATLLGAVYMLLIGGTFDATVRFRVQILNLAASSLLALIWFSIRLWRRTPWRATGLELSLLFFAGTQWLATLTSAQPRLSLEWAAMIVIWCATLAILYDLLASGWPREYVVNALLIVSAILAADGVSATVKWYIGWVRLGQWPPVPFRYFGLLGNANPTACVLNLLLPLVIVRAFSGGLRQRLTLGTLAATMLLTEYFTSSRAGWIACGVALAVLGGLLVYRKQGASWLRAVWNNWCGRGLALQAASIVVLVTIVGSGAWLLAREAQYHSGLLESRLPYWVIAWALFRAHPFMGAGPDLYPWFYSAFVSIPPDFFAPHAHSLILQILSGSGMLGMAGLLWLGFVAGRRLWKVWLAAGRPVETAGLIAGLVGVALHHLFDYLFGTPVLLFLVVVVGALALSSAPRDESASQHSPVFMVPVLLVPISVFTFALYAAYWNDRGLASAITNDWVSSAAAFEQAAKADPGLTLYWEEAAYADTRAGRLAAALPLLERAAHDDPNWAVLPATLATLKDDLGAAQAARALAPHSYLFALNAGAIAEAQGETAASLEAYRAAMNINPGLADAVFWQQSPWRVSIRDSWRSDQPTNDSALANGWKAIASGEPRLARDHFQQAIEQGPANLAAYQGLAQAYLDLRDFDAAQHALQAALTLSAFQPEATLGFHLLAGDLDEARADRAGAISEYSTVFSAVAEYGIGGPGSYGNPQRNWQVFHREALPSELVPELMRADITTDMDIHFATLARWYREAGQPDLACLVLARVHRTTPKSISGQLFVAQCPSP